MKERDESTHTRDASEQSDGRLIIRRAGQDRLGIEPGILRTTDAGSLPETTTFHVPPDERDQLSDEEREELAVRLAHVDFQRWKAARERAGIVFPFGPPFDPDTGR